MNIEPAQGKFSFSFTPECEGKFLTYTRNESNEPFLQALCEEAVKMGGSSINWPAGVRAQSIIEEFPALFSSDLGTADRAPYEIELSDSTPVRSPPYCCAPPKLETSRSLVNSLLRQGVVRPSKSPYASPAFLVPKKEGGFQVVVDYWKVNWKVVFDSYPLPTVEQALEQFGGAVEFSALDLNSAYFQIPCPVKVVALLPFVLPSDFLNLINYRWG
jgi:hypothetical protein